MNFSQRSARNVRCKKRGIAESNLRNTQLMGRRSYSRIARLSISMITLLKLSCRVSATPIKTQQAFFSPSEINNTILKFKWTFKGPRIVPTS